MKLGKAGEPRGNRFTKTIDVLKVKEEPEAAWDQRDVAKALKFLEEWKNHFLSVGYLVALLDIIVPGTVRPEQRTAVVEFFLNRINEDMQGGVRVVSKDMLVSDIGTLLLVDPSARARIPDMERIHQELASYFDNLDAFLNLNDVSQLIYYVLMEPDGKKLTDSAWEDMMDRVQQSWESSPERNYESVMKILHYARTMSPERFSAHPPSEEMRQSLLVYSKKHRTAEQNERDFSVNLFHALILAADEVSVTSQDGLKVRLPAAKITPGSKLPERNTV